MPDKTTYIISVLQDIHNTIDSDEVKVSTRRLMDTVFHSAPEIVDQRWVSIFNLCQNYINDAENETHLKCFEIYNNGYKEYCRLFKNKTEVPA